MNYQQWISFTFRLDPQAPSLLDSEYPGSPDEALDHCMAFFRNPMPIVEHVPKLSLNAALHRIPSIDGYLGVLTVDKIPWRMRIELIESHLSLFSKLFWANECDGAAFLWWEYLAGAEWNDSPRIADSPLICQELLCVINKILYLESDICTRSALHGINELGPFAPPQQPEAILTEFLASERARSPFLREYAQAVASGRAP